MTKCKMIEKLDTLLTIYIYKVEIVKYKENIKEKYY
jgi:hypothetical protein